MSLKSRIDEMIAGELATREELDSLYTLQSEARLGKLVECLDDGFVRLVDHMGGDNAIVQAARVSYGKGTKKKSDDRNLIRYLMRQWHTTPFEMVEIKFHVRVPMDCWRQWVRHRTASINEYSTRYSEAIDSAQTTPTDQWRLQSGTNKQGSGGVLGDEWPGQWDHDPAKRSITGPKTNTKWSRRYANEMPSTPGEYLSMREAEFQAEARRLYQERLSLGVAREVARKDLPLSTYTEAYWKCDLHNLFHFLRLRMDSHAQLEIRTYANAIYKLIQPIAPEACEAFKDYRLDAMQLSGPEVRMLRSLVTGEAIKLAQFGDREQAEFNAKLVRLGYLPDSSPAKVA
jgi:thymidylate synthase (FAD)